MIAVLSQSRAEDTTDEVCDWLETLGADWVRINGEDLDGGAGFGISVSDGAPVAVDTWSEGPSPLSPHVAWSRRRHRLVSVDRTAAAISDRDTGKYVRDHLWVEVQRAEDTLRTAFRGAEWLTKPAGTLRKIDVLAAAREAGLSIPKTLVTNNRVRLGAFVDEVGPVITKPLGDAGVYEHGGEVYQQYTVRVDPEGIAGLPERFFPSLFQEEVRKAYELRVFYLRGRIWSSAIFSQNDSQTSVDFRVYNFRNPNRVVPYALPEDVEHRLVQLMESIGLGTGSVDMICDPEGAYTFLEVNPEGQFSMVSAPCNYHLEREVAEALTHMDPTHGF